MCEEGDPHAQEGAGQQEQASCAIGPDSWAKSGLSMGSNLAVGPWGLYRLKNGLGLGQKRGGPIDLDFGLGPNKNLK